MNSSYYTGIKAIDKRLRELYYLQGLTELLSHNSFYGDKEYKEEMEVLRWELTNLHVAVIQEQDRLLRWKQLDHEVDERIERLKEKAETFREYMRALGLVL